MLDKRVHWHEPSERFNVVLEKTHTSEVLLGNQLILSRALRVRKQEISLRKAAHKRSGRCQGYGWSGRQVNRMK